eukprot:1175408-Prorocentrum_minimum.AAC.1
MQLSRVCLRGYVVTQGAVLFDVHGGAGRGERLRVAPRVRPLRRVLRVGGAAGAAHRCQTRARRRPPPSERGLAPIQGTLTPIQGTLAPIQGTLAPSGWVVCG